MLAILSLLGLVLTAILPFLCSFEPSLFQTSIPYLFGYLFLLHGGSCLRQFSLMEDGKFDWNKVIGYCPNSVVVGWAFKLIQLYVASLFALVFVSGLLFVPLGFMEMETTLAISMFSAGLMMMFMANYIIHKAYVAKRALS